MSIQYTGVTGTLCINVCVQVDVEMVLSGALQPYPASIQQGEKQLVVYENSHLVSAAYQVASQTSTVTLPSPNIESYTRYKPTSHSDTSITYGPYEATPAFSMVSVISLLLL